MNKKMLIVGIAATAVLALAGCGKKPEAKKTYTYNTYTAVSPSNWNELTYQDSNDTQIMSYINGSFFTFNYEFDANGKIVEGGFAVEYDAAKDLKDITEDLAKAEDNDIPDDAESGYAYKITLRDDLKWDDGTEIHAEDFVYTMSEQLNPLFFNYRADSYYNSSLVIHNAKSYLFGGSHAYPSPIVSEAYGDDEYIPMANFETRTDAPAGQGSWGFKDEAGEFHDILLDFASGGNWGSSAAAAYLFNYCTGAAPEATTEGYYRFGIWNANIDRQLCREPAIEVDVAYDAEGNPVGFFTPAGDALGYNAEDDSDPVLYKADGTPYADSSKLKAMYGPNADYKVILDAIVENANTLLLDAATAAALQNCIAQMHGADTAAAYDAAGAGDYAYVEWQEMAFKGSDYPVIGFDKVGLKVGENKDELIVVLDKPLELLKEDGKTLSFKAAYNFSSLPLVKRDLYEANKVAPKEGGQLWTSTYNSSKESTASWGPYKLTSFQAGKQYILERNENCYMWNMDNYKGQYQTDRIVCDTIEQWNTAWLAFQKGDIASIGIDVSIASEYVNSSRAVFTGDDFVGSMQLQSNVEALKAREGENEDKEILGYVDFRKAISLAMNRDSYCATCTTASKAGFGLFNGMHYYDVENGGVYRNEDVAKQVLCEVYGVNVADYESLDAAYAAITGYNPELAKTLVTSAYAQAKADGVIDDDDKVTLVVGTAADTESTRRTYEFIKAALEAMVVGTPLEGRMVVKFDASFGDNWANDFRAGAYDICTGGWSGAAWDPGYFLLAYLSPQYMYSQAWDTSAETLAYDPDGEGTEYEELEMSLIDWYNCLNGASGAAYNWAEGQVENDFRLGIIAQLEKAVLLKYYSVPLYNYFSAQLRSFKIEYGSNTYNTFMGYGGIRYITYNYDDAAWEKVKESFDYKA